MPRPRTGTTAFEGSEDVEIELYALDAHGVRVEPPPPVAHRSIAETFDAWRAALDQVQAKAKHANSPGGFVAPPVDFPTRSGFREDIQVTMHADPRDATAAVLAGGIFDRDIAGLRVDPSSMRAHATELSWDVTLRTMPWRRRAATLRIGPSPSFHITVFRLTPVNRQRFATRSFVRAGLRAAFELTSRLDDELGVGRVRPTHTRSVTRSCRPPTARTTS